MKRISLILIIIISILALSSCSKSKGNIESTEFLDFDTVELKEYKNEVTHDEFIESFETKVKESNMILNDDFTVNENMHIKNSLYDYIQSNYTYCDEINYTMDGMYDSDKKILERKNKTIKKDKFTDYLYESHYQNIEKDDKYYEIDLSDDSYQERLDNISATINYLYNDIFMGKFHYESYINYLNNDVTTYIDHNSYTLIYNKSSSFPEYSRRDEFQFLFLKNKVEMNLSIFVESPKNKENMTFNFIQEYRVFAQLKKEKVNLSKNTLKNNNSVFENELNVINKKYEDVFEMSANFKENNILGSYGGYVFIFQPNNLTSESIDGIEGICFGWMNGYKLWCYKDGKFEDFYNMYSTYKVMHTHFKRVAERHYLQNINTSGQLDSHYYGSYFDELTMGKIFFI